MNGSVAYTELFLGGGGGYITITYYIILIQLIIHVKYDRLITLRYKTLMLNTILKPPKIKLK